MPFCGSCGKSTSDASQFCTHCGSSSSTANQNTKSKTENVLLDENGFFVSSARFVHNKQTYAMSGVTSVNQYVEQPSRKWPIVIMVFGLLAFSQSLVFINSASNVLRAIPGALLIVLGVWLYRRKVPLYGVVLHSASGQQRAAEGPDPIFIDRIISALNQAIILRG